MRQFSPSTTAQPAGSEILAWHMKYCPKCKSLLINGKCVRYPVCDFYQPPADDFQQQPMVFFDLETTGLDKHNCRIIEIGAVKIADGKIVDEFGLLLNPGFNERGEKIYIPANISRLTGISNAMIENQPPESEGVRQFLHWCGECQVFGGHNVAGFDLPFLKAAAKRAGAAFRPGYVFDTLLMAKSLHLKENGMVANYKQPTLAQWCGFTYQAHRAVDDIKACYQIFLHLRSLNASWQPVCA